MEIKNTVIQKDMQDLLEDIVAIDDIGEIINKAHLMLEDLTNEYLGKDPEHFEQSEFRALIAHGYTRAQRRAHICIDYICQAAEKLQELSKANIFLQEELKKEKLKKEGRMLELKSTIVNLNKEEIKQVKEYVEMLKAQSEGVCNEKK